MSTLIEVSDLYLRYGQDVALDGLSLQVSAGEHVAVVGPSGSGKSSLLMCLSGLVRPTGGSVSVGGMRLEDLGYDAAARWRAQSCGVVMQQSDLVSDLTLLDNVALAVELAGGSRRDSVHQAKAELARVGIEHLSRRFPDEVSGGERQRAAVARATVKAPPLILADEPTGALDQHNGRLVLQLLTERANEVGAVLLFITHDPSLSQVFQRTLRIEDGKLAGEIESA